jgi:hypothetical protein
MKRHKAEAEAKAKAKAEEALWARVQLEFNLKRNRSVSYVITLKQANWEQAASPV